MTVKGSHTQSNSNRKLKLHLSRGYKKQESCLGWSPAPTAWFFCFEWTTDCILIWSSSRIKPVLLTELSCLCAHLCPHLMKI
ncbi:hypothetical protein GN956_G4002 [Arapaima gigas]